MEDLVPGARRSCSWCRQELSLQHGWMTALLGFCVRCVRFLVAMLIALATLIVGLATLAVNYLTLQQSIHAQAQVATPRIPQATPSALPGSGVIRPAGSETGLPMHSTDRPQKHSGDMNATKGQTLSTDTHDSSPVGNTASAGADPSVETETIRAAVMPPTAVVPSEKPKIYDKILVPASELIVKHARPVRELARPRIPDSMRSYMSGRCIVMTVVVSREGTPTVDVVDSNDIPELLVKLAMQDASGEWCPATDESGVYTTDTVEVRYCW